MILIFPLSRVVKGSIKNTRIEENTQVNFNQASKQQNKSQTHKSISYIHVEVYILNKILLKVY